MSWIEKQYPVGCDIILPDGVQAEVVGHFADTPSTSMYVRERGVFVELANGQRTEVPESFLYEDGNSKVQK